VPPEAQPGGHLPRTAGKALRVFFRHASPQVLLLALVWDAGWRVAMGGWRWLDAGVFLGLIAYWPFHEWLIHAFTLHHPPRRFGARTFDYRVAARHRAHHADPWNLEEVFVPLHVYPWIMPLLVLGAFVLAPDARIAMTGLSTYALLSLNYEWSHYLAHIAWSPPLAYYRRRVREHRWHHFRDEHSFWGVSSGLADRCFGTARPPGLRPGT